MIGKLADNQIEEVLRSNILGRIGCSEGNKVYVVPVNYVYDGKFIIAHSMVGMKIKMMRKNPSVCFEVDEMKSFNNWRSVIAWGEYQELADERDRYYAMKLFVDKMLHVKVSEDAIISRTLETEIESYTNNNIRPVVFRIVISEKTGRHEHNC